MVMLYAGYRDEQYNRLRRRHEPLYYLDGAFDLGRLRQRQEREERLADWLDADSVLDVGGGNGELIPDGARRKLVVDISGEPLLPGVKRLESIGEARDIEACLCLHVLEHVADPIGMLRAMAKTLRRCGRIVVEVPMAGPLLSGLWPHRVHEHIQWVSPNGLDAMAQAAGLLVGRAETEETSLGRVRTAMLYRA